MLLGWTQKRKEVFSTYKKLPRKQIFLVLHRLVLNRCDILFLGCGRTDVGIYSPGREDLPSPAMAAVSAVLASVALFVDNDFS